MQDVKCPKCNEPARKKSYVGGQGTYYMCSSMQCMHTFGGEESDAKKALIAAAAKAGVTETDEVEGRV